MTANTMAVLKSCKHALLKSYMQATIVGNLLSPNRASLATTEAEKEDNLDNNCKIVKENLTNARREPFRFSSINYKVIFVF